MDRNFSNLRYLEETILFRLIVWNLRICRCNQRKYRHHYVICMRKTIRKIDFFFFGGRYVVHFIFWLKQSSAFCRLSIWFCKLKSELNWNLKSSPLGTQWKYPPKLHLNSQFFIQLKILSWAFIETYNRIIQSITSLIMITVNTQCF